MRQVLVHVSPWVGLLGLIGLGWAGWSVDCMVGWSVGWLVGQMVNQTIYQATRDNQPTNSHPTPNQACCSLLVFPVPSIRQVLVPVFPWVGLLGLVGLGCSVDWLVGRLASWAWLDWAGLVGLLLGWLVGQLVG